MTQPIMDQAIIEQIVANVLQELQPAPTPRAEAAAPSLAAVHFDAPIITAALLEERVRGGQSVRIGARSILTPTARDWLKTQNVSWQRASRNGSTGVAKSRRRLLASTVSPAVRTLCESLPRDLPGWKPEVTGGAAETAEAAVRAINAAECDLVVVISDAADVVACRANRSPRVRAAVVATTEHLRLLVEHLGPNVLAINPHGRSFIELRNLVRSCAALPAPRPPHSWD
jgi:hypothetical protein